MVPWLLSWGKVSSVTLCLHRSQERGPDVPGHSIQLSHEAADNCPTVHHSAVDRVEPCWGPQGRRMFILVPGPTTSVFAHPFVYLSPHFELLRNFSELPLYWHCSLFFLVGIIFLFSLWISSGPVKWLSLPPSQTIWVQFPGPTSGSCPLISTCIWWKCVCVCT